MATIATTITPYLGVIEHVDPKAYGDVITPFDTPTPDLLGAVTANRFPTPASAVGFTIDPFLNIGESIVVDGIEGPYTVAGALAPGGDYLEPHIGQIWPRLG